MPGPDDNPGPLGEATETRAMVRQARLRSGEMSNRTFVIALIIVVLVVGGFAFGAHYWR